METSDAKKEAVKSANEHSSEVDAAADIGVKEIKSEEQPSTLKMHDPKDAGYIDHLLGNIDKNLFDPYLTWTICKGFLRDAHTIIEWGDTFCKNCICFYFSGKSAISCPNWNEGLGGRPLDHVVPDPSIQKIVDILYPEFKELDIKAVTEMYRCFEKEGGLPVERDMKEEFNMVSYVQEKETTD